MNIYEKMAAITAELNAVAKNLKVGEGRSSYKAVGEADVLAAVKPLEAKYAVYSYPAARKIIESDIISTEKTYNGNVTKTSKFFLRLETTYRFVNIEKPEEYIDVPTYGDGVDSNDKAPGKAMTYSDKYALLKAYKIITGDDPDQEISKDEYIHRNATPQKFFCDACGSEIYSIKRKDGTMWPVADMAKYSSRRYGKPLCAACMKAAAKAEQEATE